MAQHPNDEETVGPRKALPGGAAPNQRQGWQYNDRGGRRPRGRYRRTALPPTPPGTLIVDPAALKPVIRVMAYSDAGYVEDDVHDVNELEMYLRHWSVTWVNVDGLGSVEIIQRLGEIFGLHNLALEDVLDVRQRPKVEEYGDQVFMVMRMLEPGLPVRTEQISFFVGSRFVLSFQERPGDCLDEVRSRIRFGRGRIRQCGADYLAYSLLDAIIDGYFPYLDQFSEAVEELEDEVLERPKPESVLKVHEMKRDLLTVRRVVMPLREAVNGLFRDTSSIFSESTRVYIRDCYDHVVQLIEMVETDRELVGGLLDVYLSSVNNRMNEVMKVLTIISTMFIPLGFLASMYGMNFDTAASPLNMPELRWYWGYPAFLLAIVSIAAFELLTFWRRGWLGSSIRRRHRMKPQDDEERQRHDAP